MRYIKKFNEEIDIDFDNWDYEEEEPKEYFFCKRRDKTGIVISIITDITDREMKPCSDIYSIPFCYYTTYGGGVFSGYDNIRQLNRDEIVNLKRDWSHIIIEDENGDVRHGYWSDLPKEVIEDSTFSKQFLLDRLNYKSEKYKKRKWFTKESISIDENDFEWMEDNYSDFKIGEEIKTIDNKEVWWDSNLKEWRDLYGQRIIKMTIRDIKHSSEITKDDYNNNIKIPYDGYMAQFDRCWPWYKLEKFEKININESIQIDEDDWEWMDDDDINPNSFLVKDLYKKFNDDVEKISEWLNDNLKGKTIKVEIIPPKRYTHNMKLKVEEIHLEKKPNENHPLGYINGGKNFYINDKVTIIENTNESIDFDEDDWDYEEEEPNNIDKLINVQISLNDTIENKRKLAQFFIDNKIGWRDSGKVKIDDFERNIWGYDYIGIKRNSQNRTFIIWESEPKIKHLTIKELLEL